MYMYNMYMYIFLCVKVTVSLFHSCKMERKEVTVRFRSAVTFGKFLASPICYKQMLFPLLHEYGLMGRTCYREEFRSCQSKGRYTAKGISSAVIK